MGHSEAFDWCVQYWCICRVAAARLPFHVTSSFSKTKNYESLNHSSVGFYVIFLPTNFTHVKSKREDDKYT